MKYDNLSKETVALILRMTFCGGTKYERILIRYEANRIFDILSKGEVEEKLLAEVRDIMEDKTKSPRRKSK